MTDAEIKDLCLVKLHTYRSQLDSAFAGTVAYAPDVTGLRANLKFWEQVAVDLGREGLSAEQRERVQQEAVTRS